MSSLADDILSNIDIVDVVSRYVNIKKVGKNFSGLCPFHKEKTPSFTVAPDKQIYKCFGCWAGWNAIKFVMDVERIEFMDAVKILAKDAWVDVSKYKFDTDKAQKDLWEKEKYKLMNKYTFSFFVDKLADNQLALDYLRTQRKLSDKIIDKFWLGYAPDSHYDLVKFLQSKWFSSDDMIKAWLANKWSTWDIYSFFRNRIIFPVWDHMWNVVAFSGRGMTAKDMPKYINTTETPIYEKSKVLYNLNIAKNYIKEFDKIIVVEWYMDVIALARAWINVWVATCGTALTQSHIKLLKRFTQNIIFAFDTDDAWFQATIRWLKSAYEFDLYPQILILPKWFKDIDEVINNWELIIENLEYMDWFEFVFDRLKQKYNLNSPIDRKSVTKICFDLIVSINDYSIREFYLQKISWLLWVNFSAIQNSFTQFTKENKISIIERTRNAEKKNPTIVIPEEKFQIWAFFYNNFLQANKIDTDKVQQISEIFASISSYFESSFLNKLLDGNIDEEEKQKLLEAQLWWETQFDLITMTKKDDVVYAFLSKQLHKLTQLVAKSVKLKDNEKHQILETIKKLPKK